MTSRAIVWAAAVLVGVLLTEPAAAAVKKIALSTDPVPEGNGLFGVFNVSNATAPLLNNAGQVAFYAILSGAGVTPNNDTGLYLYDGTALKKVVRENEGIPDGTGQFNVLSDVPSLNETGLVAFESSLRNTPFDTNAGTYLYNGGPLVKLARRGDGMPDGNGLFTQSLNTTVNSIGHVRMKISISNTSGGGNDDLGIYIHNGEGLAKLVRENEIVPEGNGNFADFFDFKQGYNNSDQVAFHSMLRNTSGGTNDNEGIYLYNGSAVVNLARTNTNVPEGNGVFGNLSASAQINSAGKVAFQAILRGTSGASIDNSGIYLHNGSALVNLARESGNIPEGSGKFDGFNFPVINDAGQVAFQADLRNTNGGNQDNSGLYVHNGTALVKYVRENDVVPEGNGRFNFFNYLQLNAGGQIAFEGFLKDNSGGVSDDVGIYVSDGIETVKVAREGDTLAGGVATFLNTSGGYAGDLGLRKSFNDFGQVAFRAVTGGSQGIYLFTPDLRWRATTNGSWDTATNWTLSLKPGTPHAVTFNPATNLTITGPAANVTVSSLTIGGNGTGNPTLNLKAGGVLTATTSLSFADDATIGFELGGTNLDNFARLMTAGTALVDGDFTVQFVNGFLPAAGNEFTILSALGGISGMFDTLAADLPALTGGLNWQINYSANDVTLAVLGVALLGDYNGDHTVNAADYTVWRNAIAANATSLMNDPTPGVVNFSDYTYWRDHYGATMGAGTTAVPEPGSLVLFTIALIAMALQPRRRY